VLLDT
jgi:hypothetical protein